MNFKELLAGFGNRWQSLSQTKKIVAILAATVVLVALAVLGQSLFGTSYAPLFTGLDPKDAGKITEELKKEKIPYRVSGQGKIIEVPEKVVYETRIKLASSGALYSSGVGFELFDQKKFGVTEFEQQVGYQRALQEELRRTIVQVDAVEEARVHLVLPKKSLFLNDQAVPSASIALKLKPEAKISSENVKGIVEFVAGSVEGLKPENIHIIDMQGNSLSDNLKIGDKSASLNKATFDRNEIRRSFEKELETRIHGMLGRILGPGMAVAMVTAELDFDQQQSKTTTYDKGQVLSEHNVDETGAGPGGTGGVPGTDSDLPGKSIPAGGSSSGSSFSKQENTTNYQVPNKEETVVKAPGTIKRLSASVVLNGNYSQAQVQQIHDLVATAIGFNVKRGDAITVSGMAFDESEKKEFGAELARLKAKEEERDRLIMYGVIAASVLVLLGLLWFTISRQYRKRAERVAELRRQEEEARRLALLEEASEEVQELPKIVTRQDEIREMASQNPEDIAEILKVWLKE